MPPDNPTPGAQSSAQPGESPAQPRKDAGQPRPKPPPPARPAPPGAPLQAPGPAKRQDPLILLRTAMLIGSVVFTYLALAYLSFFGNFFAKVILGRPGWEKILIKHEPTPAPTPAHALPSAFGNPKSVPAASPPQPLRFQPRDLDGGLPPPVQISTPSPTPAPVPQTSPAGSAQPFSTPGPARQKSASPK